MASQMYHMYDINKQKERKVPAKLLLYNWVLYSVLNAIIISYPQSSNISYIYEYSILLYKIIHSLNLT